MGVSIPKPHSLQIQLQALSWCQAGMEQDFVWMPPPLQGLPTWLQGWGHGAASSSRAGLPRKPILLSFFPSPKPARGIRAPIHSVQGEIPPHPVDSLPPLTPQAQQSPPGPECELSHTALTLSAFQDFPETHTGNPGGISHPTSTPCLQNPPLAASCCSFPCSTSLIQHQLLGQCRRPRISPWKEGEALGMGREAGGMWKGDAGGRCTQ